MSARRKRESRGTGRKAVPAAAPARPGRGRAALSLGLALAAALAALVWWRSADRSGAPRPTLADSVAALDGPAAVQAGLTRIERGQRLASLPFFEHALERGTGRDGQVVSLYAAVLQDVALDSTMRSSVERTVTMQHALAAIERVAARTTNTEQQAAAWFQHSYILRVVGFPVDALVELNLAAGLHPDDSMDDLRYSLAMRLRFPEDPAR